MQLFLLLLRLYDIKNKIKYEEYEYQTTFIAVDGHCATGMQDGECRKNSENYVERNINVNDFTDISIEGSNNVYFIQGNKTSVKVSGNEEDIKRMKIYSKDNTLHIKEESKSISLMITAKKSAQGCQRICNLDPT